MINYDKVPLPADRMSTLTAMLQGGDMALFLKCVKSDAHAFQIDAANLRWDAARWTPQDASKKMEKAKLIEEDAMHLAALAHMLENYISHPELSIITIKPE